ncbi:MAG TPA: ATP-binding protein [Thermodesulfobacteriota bacterium]|nr:ATP-binding protein [Thermodesulfobacteriota bacterium]
MVLRSLKTKILLSVIIAVVVIEGLFLYLNIRSLSQQMIDKTEEEAFNLSETIRLSIRNAMIKDRRDEYQRIIDDVAERKGISEVRIFNKLGEITVSSDKSKVGTVVDKKAEACFGCHREDEARVLLPSDSKTRIYHRENQSLLGLINPIYNESPCYPCHPKNLNVLGVLDTTISLEGFEKEKARIYTRMITTGIISVLLLSFLLSLMVTRFVNRPIDKLRVATKKAADGNLDQAVSIRSHDELGELSESFNNMITELKRSRDAIEGWTQTLEHRVQERTHELQQVQDQLIHAGKMAALGELAAGVAHEINNPLTGVLTFSSLLLKKVDETHPWKKDLETIVQQTSRCRNIVKGLLDFARQRKPDKKEWDIHTLIERTIRLVEQQAPFQNIQIIKQFKTDLPMLYLDGDQIQQVFMNIILNAGDAMSKKGGTLTIKTESKDGTAEVSFTDTGAGISKEHLSKLFDPFFTTKETGKGTGLGLAISYGIIQSHGGDIKVESEGGKGTTFRIKLPIESRNSKTAMASQQTTGP